MAMHREDLELVEDFRGLTELSEIDQKLSSILMILKCKWMQSNQNLAASKAQRAKMMKFQTSNRREEDSKFAERTCIREDGKKRELMRSEKEELSVQQEEVVAPRTPH